MLAHIGTRAGGESPDFMLTAEFDPDECIIRCKAKCAAESDADACFYKYELNDTDGIYNTNYHFVVRIHGDVTLRLLSCDPYPGLGFPLW